jgi:hypothetical protein
LKTKYIFMKGSLLFVLCALVFTMLTSEQGCEDKSASRGTGSNGQTSSTTSHPSRVPVNGGLTLLVVAGVGLGAYAIVKRKYRKATTASNSKFND